MLDSSAAKTEDRELRNEAYSRQVQEMLFNRPWQTLNQYVQNTGTSQSSDRHAAIQDVPYRQYVPPPAEPLYDHDDDDQRQLVKRRHDTGGHGHDGGGSKWRK